MNSQNPFKFDAEGLYNDGGQQASGAGCNNQIGGQTITGGIGYVNTYPYLPYQYLPYQYVAPQQGWICPLCNAGVNPNISVCPNLHGSNTLTGIASVTTTTVSGGTSAK